MALTAVEEAQTRELLAQQAAILSLADSEAAIISNLGATDVSLSDLEAASSLGDADLLLVRQGVTDKSLTGALAKAQPDASTTVKGIVELATVAETIAGTDAVRAVTPAALVGNNRVAKAWVNFDGTATGTITPVANFNVSSVTKNATGDYTLNFSAPLADANYVPNINCSTFAPGIQTAAGVSAPSVADSPALKTTTALRIITGATQGGTNLDVKEVYCSIFGN